MSALFEVFLLTEFFYYGFCFLALNASLTKSYLTIETIYQIYTFLALWETNKEIKKPGKKCLEPRVTTYFENSYDP